MSENFGDAAFGDMNARAAKDVHARRQDVVFLDVREPHEWNMGRIPGAIHIPRGALAATAPGVLDPESRILVYCARGARSAVAAEMLRRMGYSQVGSLTDGLAGWLDVDGEVEVEDV
jgi:adenylyltransferase/sulfurtransferase